MPERVRFEVARPDLEKIVEVLDVLTPVAEASDEITRAQLRAIVGFHKRMSALQRQVVDGVHDSPGVMVRSKTGMLGDQFARRADAFEVHEVFLEQVIATMDMYEYTSTDDRALDTEDDDRIATDNLLITQLSEIYELLRSYIINQGYDLATVATIADYRREQDGGYEHAVMMR